MDIKEQNQITWKDWLYATRPRTFTLSLIPVLVGTVLAMKNIYPINFLIAIEAFLFALFIQIGTHFVNDAFDTKKDVDNENRIGPKRITNNGTIPSAKVLALGFFSYLIAAVIGIPLVIYGGSPMIFIIIASIFTGYCYTGGPYPLSYTGLADFFVIIFYGWIAIISSYYLQTGTVTTNVWIAGAQIGLLATLVLAIQNYRDMLSDAKGLKKSLAVRFGKTFSRIEVTLMCFIPLLLSLWWVINNYPWAGFLSFLTFPLATNITRYIWKIDPSPECTSLFPKSILFHLLFGIALTIGILLS